MSTSQQSGPGSGAQWTPSEHGTSRRSLQKSVTRGLKWTLIDTWGSQLLGLVIFAIMARLLAPIDVGLVALAAVFVALGQLLVDQGLGDALIQRASLTPRQLSTAFWTALLTGSLLCLLGILLGPIVAMALGDERLAPIIQVLSAVFVLAALSSTQIAILRRELEFRKLAFRRLVAISAGGVFGITLALMGFGPWALVGQQLANAAVSVAMLWAASPWRPSFQFARSDFRSLFSFGANVLVGDLLFFLSKNTDNLLIGVFLGPLPLGFYAIAYKILDATQVLLLAAARRLVFPTFARLQHDLERTRRAYLRVARTSAAITFPGYVGLAVVAYEAIVVIFGDKWGPSAMAAALLLMVGPPLSLQAFSGAVWNALGHPQVTLRFRLLSMLANVVGFAIAVFVFGNIVAVAAAFAVRSYLLLPLNLYWMKKYASVPIGQQLAQWRGVAVAAVVMAVAVLAVKLTLAERVPLAVLLAIEIAVGAIVYVAILWVVQRPLARELATLVMQVIPGAGRVGRKVGLKPARPRPPANPGATFATADDDRDG